MEKIRVAAYSDPSILLKNNLFENLAKALNSTDKQMEKASGRIKQKKC